VSVDEAMMTAAVDEQHRRWRRNHWARPRQQGLGGVCPCLPVTISPAPWVSETFDGPAPEVSGWACVDTGTAHPAIDMGAAKRLGLQPCGTRGMQGIVSAERLDAPLFAATLTFPPNLNLEPLVLCDFLGVHLEWDGDPEIPGKPIIVLLGRAALMRYTVIIDGPTSSITLIRRE